MNTEQMKIRKRRLYRNAMSKGLLFLSALILSFWACQSSESAKSPLWSVRMAESVMKQSPEPWTVDFRETPKWEYAEGLIMKACMELWDTTHDTVYFRYVKAFYDKFVHDDGSIETYDLDEYNIDRINPGKVLFQLYRETGDEKYKKAILLLRKQMQNQPRTNEGGFWHKKIYPYQMWLDGLYMGSPFLAEFAKTFDEPQLFDEVANQFIWLEKHARDEKTGLLYHGWDESRQQRWANPKTGLSSQFWGRGMGWYAMALIDVLDFMPIEHPKRPNLLAILNRLATAIANVQDSTTGVWYQILDQGGREGNYLESSASCMFVYALAKAAQKGYIDSKLLQVARKGYGGILSQFIEVGADGLVSINMACGTAGLGGNPYRDGSYEYYISEKIRSNDPKAVGPFILASLEFEANANNSKTQ